MAGQPGARPTVYVRGIIRISYGAGKGEGGKERRGEERGKDQQKWGAEEGLRASKRDREREKSSGKGGDLFKNQGLELATLNFSSYS